MLEQQAAHAMAVAVHELTTNAVKCGALSTPRGASAVKRSCDPVQRYRHLTASARRPRYARRACFGGRRMRSSSMAQAKKPAAAFWRCSSVCARSSP